MVSYRLGQVLTPMTDVLTRRPRDDTENKESQLCEYRGRGWSGVPTSLGTPRMTGNHKMLEESRRAFREHAPAHT